LLAKKKKKKKRCAWELPSPKTHSYGRQVADKWQECGDAAKSLDMLSIIALMSIGLHHTWRLTYTATQQRHGPPQFNLDRSK
jgi:hypothetical protein